MSTSRVDARELRNVLGNFVTGVTVITTLTPDGKAHGLTANSFSSVSLDPPLILWSQSLSAPSYPVFRDAERFAISILADDQVDISNRFARGGIEKFEGVRTRPGIGGIPLIEDCVATLECAKVTSYPGGDHVVFIGRVERMDSAARRPLAFGGGKYVIPHPHDLGTAPSQSMARSIAELHAVRMATQAIVELSDRFDETIGLGVWGNKGPTMVRWEESKRPVSDNLRTGLVLPLLKSATGLAFAAHLPQAMTLPVLEDEFSADQLPRDAGEATLAEMADALAEIRRVGLARVVGTSAFTTLYGGDINAVSAPVFDRDGRMILALTTIGGTDTLDATQESPIATALAETARMLSRRLGYLEPGVPTP
jgi:flavin reductase (DIM6/NTAB) family NADH-FMN oxidoreductase RutF/DNA-binding IclR family transcriptional regulator